jgi:hypothetical protein
MEFAHPFNKKRKMACRDGLKISWNGKVVYLLVVHKPPAWLRWHSKQAVSWFSELLEQFIAKQSSHATCHGGACRERRYSSYSFRPLPRGKDPQYPLYRRLGGLQSRPGHRG